MSASRRDEHLASVEAAAAELGATVERDGGGHLRVQGNGWFATFPSTPKAAWSLQRCRSHLKRALWRQAAKKAERIGRKTK